MHWNLKAVQWAVYYFHCLVLCTVQCTVQCSAVQCAVCSLQCSVHCSVPGCAECSVQCSRHWCSCPTEKCKNGHKQSEVIALSRTVRFSTRWSSLLYNKKLCWSGHHTIDNVQDSSDTCAWYSKFSQNILIQSQFKSLNIETSGWLFADMTMVACYQYGGNCMPSIWWEFSTKFPPELIIC